MKWIVSLPFVLAILIALLSVGDVWWDKDKQAGRVLKYLFVALTIMLLIAQKISDNAASKEAEAKLHAASKEADIKLQAALEQQRNDLTEAFSVGTNQVIKATNQTASQTRRSATEQTNAIKKQVGQQFEMLEGATLGSKTCPTVLIGSSKSMYGRPDTISVMNPDKEMNMFNLNIGYIENGSFDPSNPAAFILQNQSFTIPVLMRQRLNRTPITLLSKTDMIDLQVKATTPTTTCDYRLRYFDLGNNVWEYNGSAQYQDGKPIHEDKPTHAVAETKQEPH